MKDGSVWQIFVNEVRKITGKGNHVNLQKLALKNSWNYFGETYFLVGFWHLENSASVLILIASNLEIFSKNEPKRFEDDKEKHSDPLTSSITLKRTSKVGRKKLIFWRFFWHLEPLCSTRTDSSTDFGGSLGVALCVGGDIVRHARRTVCCLGRVVV